MQSKTLIRYLFLCLGMVVTLPVYAQSKVAADLQCKVTSVHDGDSMRVRCPGYKKTMPVRLDQIDAPELDQAHGIGSRNHLRSICAVGTPVLIKRPEKDQYNRTLGQVYCNKVDVNAAMVQSGSAWVYDHYVRDKSLYALQDQARAQGLGLWSNRKAVAPWKFRQHAK